MTGACVGPDAARMPIFHVHDPAELAVSLPWQLGVALDQDILAVILRGGRVRLVLRFDVCPPDTPLFVPPSAAEEGDEALVISYGLKVPPAGPVPTAVSAVARALDEAGIHVQDIWCAAEGELRFPLDPYPRAVRLPAAADVPLVAEWVGRGRAPELSRRQWQVRIAERDPARPAMRRQAHPDLAVATEIWRDLLDPGPSARPIGEIVADSGYRHAMSAVVHDEFRAVLHAAVCPRIRRFAYLTRAGDVQLARILRRAEAAGAPAEDHAPLEEMTSPEPGVATGASLAAAESLVRTRLMDVLRLAPEFARPSVLVILSLAAWAVGDGMLAGVAADQALSERPGDREATLVRQLLAAGARGIGEAQDPDALPDSAVDATGGIVF